MKIIYIYKYIRIGTRGNSKYHYYGIRVKPSSTLNHLDVSSPRPPLAQKKKTSNTQKLGEQPDQSLQVECRLCLLINIALRSVFNHSRLLEVYKDLTFICRFFTLPGVFNQNNLSIQLLKLKKIEFCWVWSISDSFNVYLKPKKFLEFVKNRPQKYSFPRLDSISNIFQAGKAFIAEFTV